MANEPERPIEKLLRDAARQRRDAAGAPIELHPATRRLLQGEVARTLAKPGRQPRARAEGLGRLWARFAWGMAIFAVLVVAGYVLLPPVGKGKPEARLAKNEPRSGAVPAKPAPPPRPTAVASTPAPAKPARQFGAERQLLKKDNLAAPADREVKEQSAPAAALGLADRKQPAEAPSAVSGSPSAMPPSEPAPTLHAPTLPAPRPPPPAPTSVVAADASKALTSDKADQVTHTYKSPPLVASDDRPESAYAPTEGSLKSADVARMETESASASQRFAQIAPGTKAKSSQANKDMRRQPVLASFQVEQTGTKLRIVDGDGSVYSGSMQITEATPRQRSVKAEASTATRAPEVSGIFAKKAAGGLDAVQLEMQLYSFRVVGTNRSLHKQVVFTGNLLAATNAPTVQSFSHQLSLGGGLGGDRSGSTQPSFLPLPNSRISGKVVVGNAKAVEINALPTSP